LNRFARLLVVSVAAAAPLAASVFASGPALAKSVRCDERGNCKTYCTQSLPNGNWVEYEEGTEITVYNPETGGEFKYVCRDGQWVRVRIMGEDGRPGPKLLGVIAVGSVAGVKGDYEVCYANRALGCDKSSTPIGPPGLLTARR